MLLSSRYRAYAHAIKDALDGKKPIAPQAEQLGLTAEASDEILETLHKLNVADGLSTIGRRVIAKPADPATGDAPAGRLGYLYSERVREDEDDTSVSISIGRHKNLSIEPKFALHLSGPLEGRSSFEDFTAAIIGISHAWEVLAIPYATSDWNYHDQVCANGFGREFIIGKSKTLTDKSKQNFNELLAHANFSFSKIKGSHSQIAGFTTGAQAVLSSIYDAYLLFQQLPTFDTPSGAAMDGVLALNTLCKPISVSAGEEWSFVSTGFGLKALHVKFTR